MTQQGTFLYGLNTKNSLIKILIVVFVVSMLANQVHQGRMLEPKNTHSDVIALDVKQQIISADSLAEIDLGLKTLRELQYDQS